MFPEARDPAALSHLPDHDLWLLFRAACHANFFVAESSRATALLSIFEELDKRGLATDEDARDVHGALLSAHLFDQANHLASTNADAGLDPLPLLLSIQDNSGGPSVWHWESDTSGTEAWGRIPIDLAPVQLLVISGCHNAEDAARDIANDPVLAPAFSQHARWLALQPCMESFDAVREWNQRNPAAVMDMIYDRREWAQFGVWAMPTFAVVKDGRVVESLSGWPRGDTAHRDALLAMLRRAGLLPDAPR